MARPPRSPGSASPDVDYRTLADLRYQLRRFARVREVAARAAGVEPAQYLLLLQVKGLQGVAATTIGTLAERLQIQHHGAVQLVNRLVQRDMVIRRRGGPDRRQVTVELRPAGEAVLRRLAQHSMAEMRTEAPRLVTILRRLVRTAGRRSVGSPTSRRRPRRGGEAQGPASTRGGDA